MMDYTYSTTIHDETLCSHEGVHSQDRLNEGVCCMGRRVLHVGAPHSGRPCGCAWLCFDLFIDDVDVCVFIFFFQAEDGIRD